MLNINGTDIKMTRGDSVILNMVIYTPDGNVYEMQNGDSLYFTVRELPKKTSDSPLIEKTFSNNDIKLTPADTMFLKYGRYFWDVTLIFSDGDVNTVASGYITLTYEVK